MKHLKPAIGMAFDATGVIYKSRRGIPRAKEAFDMLI